MGVPTFQVLDISAFHLFQGGMIAIDPLREGVRLQKKIEKRFFETLFEVEGAP